MTVADRIAGLPATARRSLALVLLLGSITCVWFAIAVPLRVLLQAQGQWRESARAQLAGNRALLSQASAVSGAIAALPTKVTWKRLYQPGVDVDSSLRQDVTALSSGAGITVQSVALLPATPAGALRQHGVTLTGSATIDQLTGFITHLKAHQRYLRLEHLEVTTPASQLPDRNAPLQIKLDVYAYGRSGAGPGA